MSTDKNKQELSLEEKVDSILSQIAKSKEKSLARVRDHGGAVTVSVWEQESRATSIPASKLKSMHAREMVRLEDLMANGYEQQFRSFGEFLRGIVEQSRNPGGPMAKSFDEKIGKVLTQMKAVGLNTFDADSAGIAVLPEFSPTLIDRDYSNDLWGKMRSFTVGGDNMTFPVVENTDRRAGKRRGGLTAFWRGEEEQYTSSRPKLKQVRLQLKKLTVLVYVSEELLDDNSYALEQWVNECVHDEFDFVLGEATMRGDGVNQPLGFFNSDVTVQVAKEDGQAADTIEAMNIIKMWKHRLPGTKPEWYLNQEVESSIYSMVLDPAASGAGALVFTPPGGLSAAPYATLMGRPVHPTEFNSALGDVGDIALADYKHILAIGKGGVSESVSTHVAFDRDQTAYKFSRRVDCRPQDDKPTKPTYGASDYLQSAFVTLAAR